MGSLSFLLLTFGIIVVVITGVNVIIPLVKQSFKAKSTLLSTILFGTAAIVFACCCVAIVNLAQIFPVG